jgi:hypothetical protein
VRIVAVALVSALVLSGCSLGEPALAEILDVSGDASELDRVELSAGEQTLEDVAENYELSETSVDEHGFIGAWEASFQSPQFHSAKAMLFDDAAGASSFVRALRAKFATGEYGDVRAIDVAAFGAEAITYTLKTDDIEGHLYIWPVGKIVLETFAPPETARAFGEVLMERADG